MNFSKNLDHIMNTKKFVNFWKQNALVEVCAVQVLLVLFNNSDNHKEGFCAQVLPSYVRVQYERTFSMLFHSDINSNI